MVELFRIGPKKSLEERESFEYSINRLRLSHSIILATCNRAELYSGDGEIPRNIAEHLFRVVCGLDSRIPGEKAIQGQVRRAYLKAVENGTVSSSLHRLFETALSVGKRVRRETRIDEGAVSHSFGAVEAIRTLMPSAVKAVFLGCNPLIEQILKSLGSKSCSENIVVNRTFEKGKQVADKYGAKAVYFKDLKNVVCQAEIIVTAATRQPKLGSYFISSEVLAGDTPRLLIDLAVPRNIDPSVGKRKNITLLNVHDIEELVLKNLERRVDLIAAAEKVIQEELDRFYQRLEERARWLQTA